MKSNGTNQAKLSSELRTGVFEQPKPQPLVKVDQTADKIAAKIELMKQAQELKIERLLATVAAANSALPIVNATVGNADANLHRLTEVILQRGVDIAEDSVEIIIDDEN